MASVSAERVTPNNYNWSNSRPNSSKASHIFNRDSAKDLARIGLILSKLEPRHLEAIKVKLGQTNSVSFMQLAYSWLQSGNAEHLTALDSAQNLTRKTLVNTVCDLSPELAQKRSQLNSYARFKLERTDQEFYYIDRDDKQEVIKYLNRIENFDRDSIQLFAAILGARIVDLRKLDTIEQLAEYIVELDIGDNGSATSIESDTTNACHWFEFAEILKLMGHDQIAQEILNDDTSSSSDCELTSDSGSELEMVPFNEATQGQTVSSAKIKKQFLSTQKARPQTAHQSGREQGSNFAHGNTNQPTRPVSANAKTDCSAQSSANSVNLARMKAHVKSKIDASKK